MAKELPYFKFEPSEWQNGNIQMCSELSQLYFIDMCCVYWNKLGDLSYRFALVKCFRNNKQLLDEIIENQIISINSKDNVVIGFLNKQLLEFQDKSSLQSQSGRKGGIKNGVRPEIERVNGNQFYILECWNGEERFYKIGVTSKSISRRYSGKIQYEYKVVFQVMIDNIAKVENDICEKLIGCEYIPKLSFAGQKECYKYTESQSIENAVNSYFNFAKATLSRNEAIREEEIRLKKIRENETRVENSPYGDGRLHFMCKEFWSKNTTKYETEFYKSFLEYWTAPIQKGAKKGVELWRDEKTFQLASRLRTSYNLTWKKNEQSKSKFSSEQERKQGLNNLREKAIAVLTYTSGEKFGFESNDNTGT